MKVVPSNYYIPTTRKESDFVLNSGSRMAGEHPRDMSLYKTVNLTFALKHSKSTRTPTQAPLGVTRYEKMAIRKNNTISWRSHKQKA